MYKITSNDFILTDDIKTRMSKDIQRHIQSETALVIFGDSDESFIYGNTACGRITRIENREDGLYFDFTFNTNDAGKFLQELMNKQTLDFNVVMMGDILNQSSGRPYEINYKVFVCISPNLTGVDYNV
jgi:hypothetical protein